MIIVSLSKKNSFWCCYIAKHGFDEYTQIRNNYGTKQIEIQEQISKYVKENTFFIEKCKYENHQSNDTRNIIRTIN